MIEYQINVNSLIEIEKQLDKIHKDQAPEILDGALNRTAVDARKLITKQAQQTYAIRITGLKGSRGGALTIAKANEHSLYAVLHSEGTPLELFKFKTNPSKYVSRGADSTLAKVLQKNNMKALWLDDIGYAFVVKFKSKHITLAQREGKKSLPIRTLYSQSIPQMLGNEEKVYGIVEPEIGALLQKNVKKEMEKVLEQ